MNSPGCCLLRVGRVEPGGFRRTRDDGAMLAAPPPNLPRRAGEERKVLRNAENAPPNLPNKSAKAQVGSLSPWERVGVRARATRRKKQSQRPGLIPPQPGWPASQPLDWWGWGPAPLFHQLLSRVCQRSSTRLSTIQPLPATGCSHDHGSYRARHPRV